jgi:hypothetical protein
VNKQAKERLEYTLKICYWVWLGLISASCMFLTGFTLGGRGG